MSQQNFVEKVQEEQANRLAAVAEPSREQLLTIEEEDITAAGNDLKAARKTD